jgi:hypothetical protein
MCVTSPTCKPSAVLQVGYPRLISWQTRLYTQQDLQSSLQLHQNRLYYVASTVPMVPRNLAATVSSDTAIALAWTAPFSNGGNALSSYGVEWDTVDSFDSQCGGVDEVQLVTTSSLVADGNRQVSFCFRGSCTACGAPPTGPALATDLAGLATIGSVSAVDVTRSGDDTVSSGFGYSYTITFHIGVGVANIQGDLPPVTVTSCGSTAVTYTVRARANWSHSPPGVCCSFVTSPFPFCSAPALPPFRFSPRPPCDPLQNFELVQGRGDGAGTCSAHSLASAGAVTITGNPTSYIVPDLTPGVRYFFRLRAINSDGVSPWLVRGVA